MEEIPLAEAALGLSGNEGEREREKSNVENGCQRRGCKVKRRFWRITPTVNTTLQTIG